MKVHSFYVHLSADKSGNSRTFSYNVNDYVSGYTKINAIFAFGYTYDAGGGNYFVRQSFNGTTLSVTVTNGDNLQGNVYIFYC